MNKAKSEQRGISLPTRSGYTECNFKYLTEKYQKINKSRKENKKWPKTESTKGSNTWRNGKKSDKKRECWT